MFFDQNSPTNFGRSQSSPKKSAVSEWDFPDVQLGTGVFVWGMGMCGIGMCFRVLFGDKNEWLEDGTRASVLGLGVDLLSPTSTDSELEDVGSTDGEVSDF
mmetsp:Transcript_8846/g.12182  ORF Transcript_8846/g.12182 Transcript_8846/m.12182 type:complete len:101 (+) Transcript_8846:156-458(+)